MADFTGGCCETYEMDEYNIVSPKIDPAQLHKTLVKSFNHGAIAGASIEIAGKAKDYFSGALEKSSRGNLGQKISLK